MANNINKEAVIKSIYAPNYDNINNTNNTFENYYKYENNIKKNSIYIGDKITSFNAYHSFNKHADTSNNDNTATSRTVKISAPILNKYSSYYKLLDAKDIDWDNAYLRYAQYQSVDYENPISYLSLNQNTGKFTEQNTCDKYIFNNGILNNSYTINFTYELINVVDYLLCRYQALFYEMRIIQQQREAKAQYDEEHQ